MHDAAEMLLRYLLRLSEPVIPVTEYEEFQNPLNRYQNGRSTIPPIYEYQLRFTTLLPPINRQLLLYLLDLLAVFASKSELNTMTSERLAAIFQPTILSPVGAGGDNIEEENSRRVSRDVVAFLIENQDHFLVGIS